MTADKLKTAPAVRPWVVIAFISIPVFVGSLDLTVVSAFLPELIVELQLPLQTGLDDASWVLSGYLLAYTVSLTFTGRLSDLVGRRAVYVACLLIFILGSVLVAVAHTWPTQYLNMLLRRLGERPDIAQVNLIAIIIGRVVQAFGAGALVPVSLALVGDMFPPEKRAQPLGLVGAIDTLGWVLGHLYGGIFIQFMPWQGLFWMNVPLTLVALFAVLWALRGVPQVRHAGRFDYIGTALIVGALTVLNVALGARVDIGGATNFEELGGLPSYAIPGVILALILFALFAVVESRVRDPLFNMRLFRKRNLSAGSLTNLFVGYAFTIGLVTVPILVNVRQEDISDLRQAALSVGLLLSTLTVPMALAAVPGGWLSERIGFRRTTMLGLLMSVVGFLVIWQTWTLNISNFNISWQMALVGIGLGLTFSPISASVINAAEDRDRGVASALVIILRLVGMTLSVSTLTTFSLRRVNTLVEAELGAVPPDPFVYAEVYANIAVDVLALLGFIGAVTCLLALIPAYFLQGRGPEMVAEPEAMQEVLSAPGD